MTNRSRVSLAVADLPSALPLGQASLGESWSAGARSGALAWSSYAVVEYLFLTLLTWTIVPTYRYRPPGFGISIVFFCVYPLVGWVAAGLLAILARPAAFASRQVAALDVNGVGRVAGPVTLLLIFHLNFLNNMGPLGGSRAVVIGASLVLVAALGVGLVRPHANGLVAALTDPWTVSVVLVGLPWVIYDFIEPSYGRTVRALSATAFLVLACLCGAWLARREWRPKDLGWPFSRRFGLRAAVFVGVWLVSTGLRQAPVTSAIDTPTARADRSHPNIVFISMDTVRPDHLSVYGYRRDTSPRLTELARGATLYSRALAPGSMTLASHGSFFTGVYPSWHGARDVTYRFDNSYRTIAEFLSSKGYHTVGLAANPTFLLPTIDMLRGFRYFDARTPEASLLPLAKQPVVSSRYYLRRFGISAFNALVGGVQAPYKPGRFITEAALRHLEGFRTRGERFFLFLNYMDAHAPYLPPPPFDTMYRGKMPEFDWSAYGFLRLAVLRGEHRLTDAERANLVSQYDGGIAYEDSEIGRVIAHVKQLGLYDNSLIVIASDHGESFGERRFLEHGQTVYQDQIRMALVIKYPGQRDGRLVDRAVSGVDLMPTVLEAAGVELPRDIQGRSLRAAAREGAGGRELYSEASPPRDRAPRQQRGIISNGLKLVRSTDGSHEVYDLNADPEERYNLFNATDAHVRQLQAQLTDWLRLAPAAKNPARLDRETLDALRSLGYIR
ncbi:MAG: sulfatase [Acidobacteria bacterium]|nr:sulfatase [Acidobacteriota bacterium]